jgi:hypothetical protein
MDEKDLAMLEKAFSAEVNAAFSGMPHIFQTKAKARAERLVVLGTLANRDVIFNRVRIAGYELTHFGRMTYCRTCETKRSDG